MRWLLDGLTHRDDIDAFVFVDADTVVEANFLTVADQRMQQGEHLLQASYRVLDAGSHPLISLRALAFALFHDLRGRGKSFFGLSTGLWGNGMVLSGGIVQRIPWQSFSAVEDAEQHIKVLLAGNKVAFMGETHVYGHMPASFASARKQQTRWEGGRLTLARRYGPRMLAASMRRRSPAIAAALLELVMPPLSVLAMGAAGGLVIAFLIGGQLAYLLASLAMAGLGAYVICGFLEARLAPKAYASLLYAPLYIGWKVWLFAEQIIVRREPAWTKTARKG